jgi:hypothetical protein
MLSKVRLKFRDAVPHCRFPNIQSPANKLLWFKDEFCFSYPSGIHLKSSGEEKFNLSLSVT